MIPDFYDGMYLPIGDHPANWNEVAERFGVGNARRESHRNRLAAFIAAARACGFVKVYLFGSFISANPNPDDVDLMWVHEVNLDRERLRQECRDLLDYTLMKRREGWDMFSCSNDNFVINYLMEVWRKDKSPDRIPRGVILINLQEA